MNFSFSENVKGVMADCVSIKPSKIQGVGIFANEDIKESTIIQRTHFNDKEGGWLTITPNYKYNHSKPNANCKIVENGRFKELVALRLIKKNEEILVDYADCSDLQQPEEDWVE